MWLSGAIKSRHKPCPPPTTTIQTSVKFRNLQSYIFTCWKRITFKVGNFTNFKALFKWCWRCFANWSMSKVKNRGSSKAKNGVLFNWKVMHIYLWKILFTCAMSATVFFSHLIDNNNRNKKKSTKEQKTTTATSVLKFTSSCCLFACFLPFYSIIGPYCGKISEGNQGR